MSASELATVAEGNDELFVFAKLQVEYNLTQEYASIDGNGTLPTLRTFKKFKVQSHGTNYHGQILIKEELIPNAMPVVGTNYNLQGTHKSFVFFMENVGKMYAKYDVYVNGTKYCGIFAGEEISLKEGPKVIGNVVNAGLNYAPKWNTFTGVFELRFQPKTSVTSKAKQDAKELVLNGLLKINNDCSIICQGKTFKFNKLILCSISMVFEKMFGNGYSQEASNGSVTIDDFQPDTIEAFQKTITDLMSENGSSLETRDLTPQLLMFADKYAIAFLVDTVGNHLKSSLTMETVHEVIDVAFLTNNHDLLKVTAKFLKENLENCNDESEDWKKLQELNPKCFVLIMKYML